MSVKGQYEHAVTDAGPRAAADAGSGLVVVVLCQLMSINFPAFFCRDGALGPDAVRSQQRNPNNFQVSFNRYKSKHMHKWAGGRAGGADRSGRLTVSFTVRAALSFPLF